MDARPHPRRAGFTLTELLVAISIIAVLITLILVAIPAVRDHGNSAKCMSNMRQIFVGVQLYMQENDNRLMQRYYPKEHTGYDEVLKPYITGGKQIFTCPSQERVKYPDQPGYGLNWYYDNQSIFTVEQLSKTILLAETIGGGKQVGSHRADRESKAPGQLDKVRHRGHANYLFFDGHVEPMKYEDTRQLIGKAPGTNGREIDIDLWGVYHDDHQRPSPL